MILISYPSGGFGNFIYYCLTEFSSNTYKPNNRDFDFSANGNSHATKKYLPVYFQDPIEYKFNDVCTDLELLILCDNGIHNDSYDKIYKTFNNPKIVRLTIDVPVRPVVYKTCVVKAQNSDLITENIEHVSHHWGDQDEYAIRENFTLFYHNWPFKWEIDNLCFNCSIEQLLRNPVNTVKNIIKNINGTVINEEKLIETCMRWKESNGKYFKIYYDWIGINNSLDSNTLFDVTDITDLHDQGYINYCIEQKYNVTIPVYDYRDWFANTQQIQEMVKCLR